MIRIPVLTSSYQVSFACKKQNMYDEDTSFGVVTHNHIPVAVVYLRIRLKFRSELLI